MIRLALLTSNPVAAEAIDLMIQDSGIFKLVLRDKLSPSIARAISTCDPEVILLDAGDWSAQHDLITKLRSASRRAALVAYRPEWSSQDEVALMKAGFQSLLRDPFSIADLEAGVYQAMHVQKPIAHPNLYAFLPAKAGAGCSTVVLNTAAALANRLDSKTLLLETDRRSGVIAILLNVEDRGGLGKALEQAGELTSMQWRQHVVEIGQLEMLLANSSQPGKLPQWSDYYQLLLFAERNYPFIVADLPEVINPATAEVVKAARTVFIVCEPELPSLRMAGLRRAELESAEVPPERIRLLVNRWEPGRVSQEQVTKLSGMLPFAYLPNDYSNVKNAALDGRLVAPDSSFGKACLELARKLGGMPEVVAPTKWGLGLLRRLGRT